MIDKLIIHFILGGIIFSSIYLAANVYDNPDISAVISLFPISIICGLIIKKDKTLLHHYYHLIPVGAISIVCVFLLILLIKNEVDNRSSIFITLIVWTILQILKIKFFKL
jgi:hypothetical protein